MNLQEYLAFKRRVRKTTDQIAQGARIDRRTLDQIEEGKRPIDSEIAAKLRAYERMLREVERQERRERRNRGD